MKSKFQNYRELIGKVFFLALPYGRRRLLLVFMIILAQGLMQVVGVTSIFPFLAVASDPGMFRESGIGQRSLSLLPELTNNQLLLIVGLFAIGMLFFSNLLMLTGEVVRARYTSGFAHWLRMRLLTRMMQNPYRYFLKKNTGELIKKTTGDVQAYISGVLAPLLEAFSKVVTVLLLLGTLLLVDYKLAIGASVGFSLYYIIIFYALRKTRKKRSDIQKMVNRGSMKEIIQLFSGIKPIKVHCAEQEFLNRYGHYSSISAALAKWNPLFGSTPRYLIEPLAFGGMVLIVLMISIRGENFNSIIPTLGVMALAGYRLIPSFQVLYAASTGISLMIHSLEELHEEFARAAGIPETCFAQNCQPLRWNSSIELQGITFRHEGAPLPVIDRLSLEIKKNQFVAFIGSTGSGKSTLVDLIIGLHTPEKGQFLVDGDPIEPNQHRSWRKGIGYVPQDIFLLDDTVAANIAFGEDKDSINLKRVIEVARIAQILDFVEKELPDGFQSIVGERGVRLSGGQRQRIGLARALYHKPELLVLDEATSALDSETEAALMKAIENLYHQITLIVIAHRLSTIQNADCIYKIHEGRIEESGTYHELNL